jgi:glucose dehydrogenase
MIRDKDLRDPGLPLYASQRCQFIVQGTLATAGNIVFHDSKAYNAQTGEILWRVDLKGDSVAPVTYMLDGKQYVTYIARNYPNSRMFSFVLDGNQPIPPIPAATKQ